MADTDPIPLDSGLIRRERALQEVDPEFRVMWEKAAAGSESDLKQMLRWAAENEKQRKELTRKLRKQEFDFSTLFEIVGQTSARSLDLLSMQTYLLRTVSGHFTTPKLLISRKMKDEDTELVVSAAQGLRDVKLTIPTRSPLCLEAMKRRTCFRLDSLDQSMDGLPEVMVLRELGIELAVPLIQEVEAPDAVLEGFLLLGPRLAKQAYTEQSLAFLYTLGKMLAICLRNEALYRRSIIDDLTGVASRGHFDARLAQEINRIEIYGHRSMGLVMMDVDHFKGFNDTYGHQTGDLVLQELARVLVTQVRNVDLVARYGGEEFAIILLEIDRQRVMDVAQRLRKAVEALVITNPDGKELKVTASFGAACFPDDSENRFELIQKADMALYKAKDGGRNQVVMTDHDDPEPTKELVESTKLKLPSPSVEIDRRASSGRIKATS